jgi:hypothetical protein
MLIKFHSMSTLTIGFTQSSRIYEYVVYLRVVSNSSPLLPFCSLTLTKSILSTNEQHLEQQTPL